MWRACAASCVIAPTAAACSNFQSRSFRSNRVGSPSGTISVLTCISASAGMKHAGAPMPAVALTTAVMSLRAAWLLTYVPTWAPAASHASSLVAMLGLAPP